MFVDVQSFFLNALVDTQTDGVLDSVEEDEARSSGPEVDAGDAETLRAKEGEALSVECSRRDRDHSMSAARRASFTSSNLVFRMIASIFFIRFLVSYIYK